MGSAMGHCYTQNSNMSVSVNMQVWNRVLAPMSGQHGSEAIAEGSVGILKQALQVSAVHI